MKIFEIAQDRFEVWRVDSLGNRISFCGRFDNRGTAVLYLNGRL